MPKIAHMRRRETVPTNGAAIRRVRQLAGYGNRSFALRVGIHQSHLSRLENGHTQASPDVLRKIAKAAGVKVTDLMAPDFVNGTAPAAEDAA
jgi:transcriptional regulator with XRE-family HTH domain